MFKIRMKIVCLLVLFSIFELAVIAQAPKVSVVFVIDQFAHHYLRKIQPNLRGGIKFLLDNAVVYNQANYPHAGPSTAVGHTALSTGCFAKDHGVIGNKWCAKGEKIRVATKHIMVDGISDQFLKSSLEK